MHPAMVWIRSFHGRMNNASWYHCDTCMGAFVAKTVKPTKIYGNKRLVLALGRSQAGVRGDSSTVTTVKVDPVTGARSTHGGPGLNETQSYTPTFGAAVLEAYLACGGAEPSTLSEPALDRPCHAMCPLVYGSSPTCSPCCRWQAAPEVRALSCSLQISACMGTVFVCVWCHLGPTRSGLVGATRAWLAARRALAHTSVRNIWCGP